MELKLVIVALLLFMMVIVYTLTPINEYTIPFLAAIEFLFTVVILAVLFYKYLLRLFRKVHFTVPVECDLYNMKYIICSEGGKRAGVLWLKAIPQQPLTLMEKKDRENFIESLQGLFVGVPGVGVHYINVPDIFGRTTIDYLKRKLNIKGTLASFTRTGPSYAARSELETIQKALAVLQKTPLVQGYYLVSLRAIGDTADDVKEALDNMKHAVKTRLATASIKLVDLEGEELENVLSAFFIGPLYQRRIH